MSAGSVIYATVDFDDGRAYTGNRPMGTVVLIGPGGPNGTRWSNLALVDTGADYLMLPDSAASAVGVSLAGAQIVRITGIGTSPVSVRQLNVNVEIEGYPVSVPALFAPGAKPLIGRQALFAALTTLGFSTTEWLLEW